MNQTALVISLVAGTLIPIVTGFVTKLDAHDGWKAGVAIALSAGVGVATSIQQACSTGVADSCTASWSWQTALTLFATTFGANIASYHGAWKPISKDGNIPGEQVAPNKGLGSPAHGG